MSQLPARSPRRSALSADDSLTALLSLLVVLIFVVGSFAGQRLIAWTYELAFALVVAFGVAAFTERLRWRLFAAGCAALLFLVKLTGVHQTPTGRIVDASVALVAFIAVAAFGLRLVFREGEVTRQRVEGAIAVYLLVALAWANAYLIVALSVPNAFEMNDALTAMGDLKKALGYFSFCTLTTVGYGDITPVHPVARSLASCEALIGQLYPAILIARLLSLRTIEKGARR